MSQKKGGMSMDYEITFTLCDYHIKLLERMNIGILFGTAYGEHVIPRIDSKRLFGNPTDWKEVADILELNPEDDNKYSEQQILFCKRAMIELVLAMNVIFKYKTFKTGTYSLNKIGSSYFSYRSARNYLYVEPLILWVEQESHQGRIENLRMFATNINCDVDDRLDVYMAFYKAITFDDPIHAKSRNFFWLTLLMERLEDEINRLRREG